MTHRHKGGIFVSRHNPINREQRKPSNVRKFEWAQLIKPGRFWKFNKHSSSTYENLTSHNIPSVYVPLGMNPSYVSGCFPFLCVLTATANVLVALWLWQCWWHCSQSIRSEVMCHTKRSLIANFGQGRLGASVGTVVSFCCQCGVSSRLGVWPVRHNC